MLIKVGACFFLSGMAALMYQTAWMRQLSVVFGTSELAVATVLTAYMSGLALGAALAGRYIKHVKKPLLTYGLFEGGIALTAVSVPFLLSLAASIYVGFFGGQDTPPPSSGFGQLAFFYATTLLVLVLPTALMGATLPLLSRYVVKNNHEIGRRIGGLYAINTFGAIAGTLIAGFVLLPNISLFHTILLGAVINFLVLYIVIKIVEDNDDEQPTATQEETRVVRDVRLKFWQEANGYILPIMTLSGVATFTYEVLWTRLLSHILGGSVAAFSIMLAGFLFGIAFGSEIASRYAKNKALAKTGFVISQLGIALLCAATFVLLEHSVPNQTGLFENSVYAFLILLPSTLFIGATYPFAVRLLANDEGDAAAASARVYAWNTVGAIFGASFAGFFLIPLVRYEGAIIFAVLVNLVLALAVIFLPIHAKKSAPMWLKLLSIGLLIGVVTMYRPSPPYSVISKSPISNEAATKDKIRFYEVGRSSTVLLLEYQDYFRLRNNGLPEAAIPAKTSPNIFNATHLLSLLPSIARPDSKTMLVAGFGGGVVVENLPPSIEQADVLELEPKVIDANALISENRKYKPLFDPRVNVIFNDARSALALTKKKYDVIVSQPSHPWTAGASHLYTKEYMQLAEDRLADEGVFLQWMNISFVDEYLLRSLTKTLVETFEYVRIYSFHPGVLYFLGSNSPLKIEESISRSGEPFRSHVSYFNRLGLSSVEDILSGLMADTEGAKELAELGKTITDDYNLLGTRSALSKESGSVLSLDKLNQLFLETSPLFDNKYWIYESNSGVNFYALSKKLQGGAYSQLNVALHKNLHEIKHPQFESMKLLSSNAFKKEGTLDQVSQELAKNFNSQLAYEIALNHKLGSDLFNIEEVETYLSKLGLVASATIENAEFLQLDSLSQTAADLPSFESELSEAIPSDPWFKNAIALRARWRMEAALTSGSVALAEESLALIDQAMGPQSDMYLHEIRLNSAAISDQFGIVVREHKIISRHVNDYLNSLNDPIIPIDPSLLNSYLDMLKRIDKGLGRILGLETDDADSIEKLREKTKSLLQRIDEILVAN